MTYRISYKVHLLLWLFPNLTHVYSLPHYSNCLIGWNILFQKIHCLVLAFFCSGSSSTVTQTYYNHNLYKLMANLKVNMPLMSDVNWQYVNILLTTCCSSSLTYLKRGWQSSMCPPARTINWWPLDHLHILNFPVLFLHPTSFLYSTMVQQIRIEFDQF